MKPQSQAQLAHQVSQPLYAKPLQTLRNLLVYREAIQRYRNLEAVPVRLTNFGGL